MLSWPMEFLLWVCMLPCIQQQPCFQWAVASHKKSQKYDWEKHKQKLKLPRRRKVWPKQMEIQQDLLCALCPQRETLDKIKREYILYLKRNAFTWHIVSVVHCPKKRLKGRGCDWRSNDFGHSGVCRGTQLLRTVWCCQWCSLQVEQLQGSGEGPGVLASENRSRVNVPLNP